jgi:hypothetical protein
MADIFLDDEQIEFPGEPFELVSDISLDAPGSSNHSPSYSIEYTANNGRGGIRHLLADTFKINDTRNYVPSPSSNDLYLEDDYYCGRTVSTDQEEFISVDIQPYLASDISESGSTIKNYTAFWSRPEMWRVTDDGPELYEVTNIENVKHFRILPFDEVRMYENIWPGTEVGIATGIIYPDDKRNIYVSTGVTFSSQPTGCAGIDWVGFTTTYKGDLVHDNDSGKTATNTIIIPRNTRVNKVGTNVFGINKDHTYVGIGSTVIQFKVRRIGPSGVNREYGYYFRHYDWEDPIHAYNGITRTSCAPGGGPGYWQGENQHDTGVERYELDHQFLSEYSYAFYYGKVPDGYYKKVYSLTDDPTLDINGNQRYDYNSEGRWGIYIDDEVKNYFEGRILVGHNIGIGTGNSNQPEPIVSIFNNRWKNQQDEIDSGSGGNCIGTKVTDPKDFMQFQMGLFVEDLVGIGTRIDKRYRLNVDASTNSAGIASTTVTNAARFVGNVDVVGILSATSLSGSISGSSVTGDIGGNAATATSATTAGTAGGLTGSPSITVSALVASSVRSTNLSGVGNRAVYSDASGNLTNSSSDEILKENIENLNYGLNTVCDLNPVSFNWIDKEKLGSQRELGLIAQEVQKFIPEVIGVSSEETLTLDYAKLTPVLVKAIQELKVENEILRSQIQSIAEHIGICS